MYGERDMTPEEEIEHNNNQLFEDVAREVLGWEYLPENEHRGQMIRSKLPEFYWGQIYPNNDSHKWELCGAVIEKMQADGYRHYHDETVRGYGWSFKDSKYGRIVGIGKNKDLKLAILEAALAAVRAEKQQSKGD